MIEAQSIRMIAWENIELDGVIALIEIQKW